MAYADLLTVQTLNVGDVLTAAALQQIRANEEFLVDPPAVSIFHSTTQLVATGTTGAALIADSENFDNDSMHSTSSNTSRITAQTAGRYLFIATVNFANNATGFRNIFFRKNAATDYAGQSVMTVTTGNSTTITSVRSITLAAADYVEVFASQGSGGNLAIQLLEGAAMLRTR